MTVQLGLGSNRPLRGWKGDLYEGGIRVPCFLHWPGRLPAGVVFETPTHVVDWLPTLIRAAGGDPQRLEAAEGIDLWAALRGEASPLPGRIMYWKTPSYCAVHQGDWKLIHHRRDGRSELFHLVDDPCEQTDLADRHPGRVARLLALLEGLAGMTDSAAGTVHVRGNGGSPTPEGHGPAADRPAFPRVPRADRLDRRRSDA